MYLRTYRYKSRYYSAWFEDDGKMVEVVPLESSGKGLLVAVFPSDSKIFLLKSWKSKWEEVSFIPCFVATPTGDPKRLYLHWGFYLDRELTPRTRDEIVPLNCLMEFISDFLGSHEDYYVDVCHMWEIHGGAIHHMIPVDWVEGTTYQKFVRTMKRYLSEVL